MSTGKAAFGRWIPLVDLDQVASIPLCFVVQLGHKLTPAHVTDRFGELGVLDHVPHSQTLHADRLVFTNQTCGELMQEVTTTISDPGMNMSHFLAGFLSILGPLLLLGVPSLCFRQVLLICAEELWVANDFSGRCHHEGLESQVSPDGNIGLWQVSDILSYQDGDEEAICTILGDADAAWLASLGQRTRPDDIEWLGHFREEKRRAIPSESSGCIGSRLLMALLFERGVPGSSRKKVEKSLIQMSQRLLQGHRGNLREPCRLLLLLQFGQCGTQSFV